MCEIYSELIIAVVISSVHVTKAITLATTHTKKHKILGSVPIGWDFKNVSALILPAHWVIKFSEKTPLETSEIKTQSVVPFLAFAYSLDSLAVSIIEDTRVAIRKTDWDNLLNTKDDPKSTTLLLSAKETIRLRVSRTVAANPPNDSRSKRTNWIPNWIQTTLFRRFFHRACVQVEMMVKSSAACWPDFPTGKIMSPDLELLLGSKLFCSLIGDNWTPQKVDVILFYIRSWLAIISPRPLHDTTWSPFTYGVQGLQKWFWRSARW